MMMICVRSYKQYELQSSPLDHHGVAKSVCLRATGGHIHQFCHKLVWLGFYSRPDGVTFTLDDEGLPSPVSV